ncbi:Cutinase protein palindrome-binding protein [Metarhizium rileyi]|uniref:Cutinase protein palindrome-binding protein n=1 Tax=Metarhizium rileyi (strain RCEF 4871) TaxID=1649241 RepID=A0A167I112_METRR|nr:Cutinase protein palindrome-binding protein [Metarhizium rileyi RCEF 4871]
MSHGPPPPPPPSGNFFAFSPFNLNDLSNAHNSQFPNGPSNNDLMSFFDDGDLLDAFGDVPMNIDTENDAQAIAANHPIPADTSEDIAMINNADAQASSSTVNQQQDDPLVTTAENVPGAGPLPPRTFAQMSLNGGSGSTNASTLTDFTKRRNWPAKVVEELKDLLHILDANGRIKFASSSILSIAGHTAAEIQDVFLKDLIHPDDQGVFVAELNESIASGNPLRMFYRFRTKSDTYVMLETVGHAHIAAARFAPNPNNQSPFCQAVFMMSRVYPTKNAELLDSFLEHKMENERLRRRIAELRREEEAETEESNRQWVQSQEGRSDIAPSEHTATPTLFFRNAHSASDTQADGFALTRENLEGVGAGRNLDSLGDKMARYEGSTHAETIEMLTGLRYLEGERSRGITTGGSSPTLIRGDAGIAIPIDRDTRAGEKKKKLKTAEEYVCTDCGTLDSPEWRKGPNGPKTLCNACGLRWAKKEKKRNNASQKGTMADQNMG